MAALCRGGPRGRALRPHPAEEAALCQIICAHLERYPRMEIHDLYKLLHQAALGSEHAVRDLSAARVWLERELRALAAPVQGAAPVEPVFDPVSPDGRILRVHLRPYVASGGDTDRLLTAFVCTANAYRGKQACLRRYLGYATHVANHAGAVPTCLRGNGGGRPSWTGADLERLSVEMAERGFPAVHHSRAYREAYRPAYRVVAREYLLV